MPALFTVTPPAPEMMDVLLNEILPAPAAFRVSVPVAAIPPVVTEKMFAVVLVIPPPPAFTVNPRLKPSLALVPA